MKTKNKQTKRNCNCRAMYCLKIDAKCYKMITDLNFMLVPNAISYLMLCSTAGIHTRSGSIFSMSYLLLA